MSFPLDHRPTIRPEPPFAAPATGMTGVVQLHQEQQQAVVWVPDAYGRMVPVSREQADALIAAVPATGPRDLSPRPVIDSRAQVVLAAGVGTGAAAAGVGYGLGQVLAPLVAIGSSGVLWALALIAVLGAARRAPAPTTTYITTHTTARWWGKATTSNRG
ncbi:hypothetical protein [Streptomyces sp. NPDC051662]|uniref:hypothetical protein n=1 Tax=Streptomyces sp. NPDC051662 TaxID=3154750 RepID=UPI00342E75CA